MVGGVPHFTKTQDTYMGYHIPANSIVLANAFAITRDESVFGEDADNFVPERWMAEEGGPDMDTSGHAVDLCGLNTTVVRDLPQTGFGFGRRICTGRNIARNQLFIQMARMLWAFDVEAGVVDDATGRRHPVHDMDCTEGFVTLPKPFRAEMRPRGDWVRRVILESGTTHGVDHAAMLDQISRERA